MYLNLTNDSTGKSITFFLYEKTFYRFKRENSGKKFDRVDLLTPIPHGIDDLLFIFKSVERKARILFFLHCLWRV